MLFGKRPRHIRRIAIVEDEPLVAFDNEHMLQAAGYEVTGTVDTAAAGKRLLAETPPDLLLADVRLSDGDGGLEVAAAARRIGIPVLFVAGACPPEGRAIGLGWLAKPFAQRELLATIEAVEAMLGGRRPKRLPSGLTLFDKTGDP